MNDLNRVAPRPKAWTYPLSLLVSLILWAAAGMLLLSLGGILFMDSANGSLWLGAVGFLATALASVYLFAVRPLPLESRWKVFSRAGKYFGAIGNKLWVLSFLCALLVIGGCTRGNVPPYDGRPVFAQRDRYQLRHGADRFVDVSRARYLLIGVGFHVGWHCGALGAVFLVQRGLCCGPGRKTEDVNE